LYASAAPSSRSCKHTSSSSSKHVSIKTPHTTPVVLRYHFPAFKYCAGQTAQHCLRVHAYPAQHTNACHQTRV
jgi:hypothetical protein